MYSSYFKKISVVESSAKIAGGPVVANNIFPVFLKFFSKEKNKSCFGLPVINNFSLL